MNLNLEALEDGRQAAEALQTCFLCGKRLLATAACWFGTAPEEVGPGLVIRNLAPQLPCHRDCAGSRTSLAVATAYHRAVADILNVRRAVLPHHIATA